MWGRKGGELGGRMMGFWRLVKEILIGFMGKMGMGGKRGVIGITGGEGMGGVWAGRMICLILRSLKIKKEEVVKVKAKVREVKVVKKYSKRTKTENTLIFILIFILILH
jgi:hypothetical protein